jgi:aminoglycoside 6'-N-acetyltransferase I
MLVTNWLDSGLPGEKQMQRTVTTRRATMADFQIALPLLERFFAEEGFQTPPGQIGEQLAVLLDDDESAVFLAWLGDRAVGVATVTTTGGIELGLSAELEDLYVLPEARGRGTGGALIEAVKAWCRAQGCTLVSVIVTPEGQAAHNLIEYYRGRGFEETGRTLLFARLE